MAKPTAPPAGGFVTLPYALERAAPPFETNAIKYPESLVRHFLKRFTAPGDTVFDPFAGLGTTLFVAEALRRVPYGVEADRRRYEWTAGQLRHWQNLRHGDSAALGRFGFPPIDFCMTSPPFMRRGEAWNPLAPRQSLGEPAKAGYAAYLRRLRTIVRRLAPLLRPKARVVVQVDNLPGSARRPYTPLVHDMAAAFGRALTLEEEIIVAWRGAPAGYAHTHCLVFRS